MEYFRRKRTGERVYISKAKQWTRDPNPPGEMVYRVKDGHALWGVTRNDLITEEEYLKTKKK